MTTVREIKSAIRSLPHQEYIQLLRWIYDKDWDQWDKQLEADVASGKLDFLAKEALEEKKNNKLREL
jgi:hypothetical protein